MNYMGDSFLKTIILSTDEGWDDLVEKVVVSLGEAVYEDFVPQNGILNITFPPEETSFNTPLVRLVVKVFFLDGIKTTLHDEWLKFEKTRLSAAL